MPTTAVCEERQAFDRRVARRLSLSGLTLGGCEFSRDAESIQYTDVASTPRKATANPGPQPAADSVCVICAVA